MFIELRASNKIKRNRWSDTNHRKVNSHSRATGNQIRFKNLHELRYCSLQLGVSPYKKCSQLSEYLRFIKVLMRKQGKQVDHSCPVISLAS